MLPSCFVAGRAEESPSLLSHRAQLSQLWRRVSVASNASIRPCQKRCLTHWKAAFLRAATAHSAAARSVSLCSSAQVLRVVGALRRRAAPRSQLVGPPKGGNCTAPATLGKGSRRVQPSLRVLPAWPNPSFNLSANSRPLGPHSAVVYRRTVRPKHPAVVARLTQTLGHATKPNAAPAHAARLRLCSQRRRVAICAQSSRSAFAASPFLSLQTRIGFQQMQCPSLLRNTFTRAATAQSAAARYTGLCSTPRS